VGGAGVGAGGVTVAVVGVGTVDSAGVATVGAETGAADALAGAAGGAGPDGSRGEGDAGATFAWIADADGAGLRPSVTDGKGVGEGDAAHRIRNADVVCAPGWSGPVPADVAGAALPAVAAVAATSGGPSHR
jgi:hypothetical protein